MKAYEGFKEWHMVHLAALVFFKGSFTNYGELKNGGGSPSKRLSRI